MMPTGVAIGPLEGRVASHLGLASVAWLVLVGGCCRGRGCCGSTAAVGTDPIGRRHLHHNGFE